MFAKHSLGGTILSFGLFNPKNTSFLKVVKNHNSTTVNSVDVICGKILNMTCEDLKEIPK